MLSSRNRLTKKEVACVFKKGTTTRYEGFIVRKTLNRVGRARFAVVVSAKKVNKAVERNKIRRKIFEIIRKNLSKMRVNYDVTIVLDKASKSHVDEDALVGALWSAHILNP